MNDAKERRNKPARIIIVAVFLLVILSVVGAFWKISQKFDDMNTYSGAALQARRVLDDITKISDLDLSELNSSNASENAEQLKTQVDALQNDIYDLNHNKLISSDGDARAMYDVIQIESDSLIQSYQNLIENIQKMANNEPFSLELPNKQILSDKTKNLVIYLEQKSLQ